VTFVYLASFGWLNKASDVFADEPLQKEKKYEGVDTVCRTRHANGRELKLKASLKFCSV